MEIGEKFKAIRKGLGFTQEAFADELDLSRAAISSYEEGRALPGYPVLIKIADLSGLTVDQIIRTEFNSIKVKRTEPNLLNWIPIFPVKAEAGSMKGFPDDEYIKELPHFSLPFLGPGNFMAFEIRGDSMPPFESGTIIVGEKLERLNDLKDGDTHIVLSKSGGLAYKRVFNYLKESGVLLLHPDNDFDKPYLVDPMEVKDIWISRASISKSFPKGIVPSKSELKKVVKHLIQ